ncbi:PREDICTED: nicastrin [Sturnus vulgaris]|uniref:nicastrin n=1 Tax=Sturnus vulgaris TaxID=9172 RepID=UPI00071A8FE3|nr:PREDICTED: nicastrin [Sturnus vulgaris]
MARGSLAVARGSLAVAPGSLRMLRALLVAALAAGPCLGNSVERKIYIPLNHTAPCVRLLNATHQIGCQCENLGIREFWEFREFQAVAEGASRVRAKERIWESREFGNSGNSEGCLYSEQHGSQFAHCNGSVWNPVGSGVSYEDFPFPIFLLQDANETEVIKECFRAHNVAARPGEAPQFPLCAMQLQARMHAATSTVTCMRRSSLQSTFSINPEIECDPLRDYNIWSSLQPINASGKVDPEQRLILAVTRVRSLRNPGKIMEKSWENHGEVQDLLAVLRASSSSGISLQEPEHSQPLPPSSFQRFLRSRDIPGVVLSDHQVEFQNRYYQSIYDTAENIGMSYPEGLSPEERLEFVTDTAKALTEVGTLLARALFSLAGGNGSTESIQADSKTVTRLLYGFLLNSNNSWFQSVIKPDQNGILGPFPQHYVAVSSPTNTTQLLQAVLANLTGSRLNLSREQCQDPGKTPGMQPELFEYWWVQGPRAGNSSSRLPGCVRSGARLSPALSPAFELRRWDSREFSTWTESRWKDIRARIFLVASRELELLTLSLGVLVLLLSLLCTFLINAKASLLFGIPAPPGPSGY